MPANDRRSRSKDRRSRSKGRRQRRMRIYDEKGSFYVVVRMPTTASRIARYHNAVRRFVQTGDASKLRDFRGGWIVDARGRRHPFLTDPSAIRRLARAGELRFESIY